MFLVFDDGSKVKVPHQFFIHKIKERYLKKSCRFIDNDEVIDAPLTDTCEKCGELYEGAPGKSKFLCEDVEFNRKMNRPARICSICYYRPYHESGITVPAPLIPFF